MIQATSPSGRGRASSYGYAGEAGPPAAGILLAILAASTLIACSSSIPSRYVKQAEPGVTLTVLVQHPQAYEGKVVILGGAIKEAVPRKGRLWIRMSNRPLDQDYRPHRPASLESPEAGHYWVALASQTMPTASEHWARVTVVGRVLPPPAREDAPDTYGEPVLSALYVKGWSGRSGTQDSWEQHIDANYVPTMPRDVRIE